MKEKRIQFSNPVGTFKSSIRAYRTYKKQWQERVNAELDKRDEERRMAVSEMQLELA